MATPNRQTKSQFNLIVFILLCHTHPQHPTQYETQPLQTFTRND